jgi:hypothetical protein
VVTQPLVQSVPGAEGFDRSQFVDHVADMESLGVTGITVFMPAVSRAAMVDRIATFGAEVVARS